jgi:uncharacterized protein (TIGR03067 family)
MASSGALAADNLTGPASKQLEGTWEIVSVTRDGKEVASQGQANLRFVVKDGKWQVKKGDQTVEEGTFKIDPSTKPHRIDVTPTTGKHSGQTLHGIYEVNGDTARDCFAMQAGQARPSSFSGDQGSHCRLTMYRRMRP